MECLIAFLEKQPLLRIHRYRLGLRFQRRCGGTTLPTESAISHPPSHLGLGLLLLSIVKSHLESGIS